MGSLSIPHFVIFPFMSQGHTTPLVNLSRLLSHRSVVVTIITTPGNTSQLRAYLRYDNVSFLELPFPENVDGVPAGIENTSKLPSMSCFLPFAQSTKLMQNSFEQALQTLNPPVSCIVSDLFLGWTRESADKLGVPRICFMGMSNYASCMFIILRSDRPHANTKSPDEHFLVGPDYFPHVKLTRNDFEPPFNELEPSGPLMDFMVEQLSHTTKSAGVIMDSFYELESSYADHWNTRIGPKGFCVGPLCMAMPRPPITRDLGKPSYMEWLDEEWAKGGPVLYVAFGTQAEVLAEQLGEIAKGLEESNVSFLWALRSKELPENFEKFEDRVKGRGLIVREWVDQPRVLRHDGVKGFLSHCGWNSVVESICAGVPLLAMPLMAEQHLNARFVAEEVGVGLRIMPRGGTVRGFVEANEVERKVRELMEGEKGAEVRKRVAEYSGAARGAMKEGCSSWRTLDSLVADVRDRKLSSGSLPNGGDTWLFPSAKRNPIT